MPGDTSRWIVQPEEARSRLDQYLTKKIPLTSRSQVQGWIRSTRVLVNGRRRKTGYELRPGDEITLDRPSQAAHHPHPEAIPLTVLYQDTDLAVIDKPAGMVCHLGAGVRSGTLVNALIHHLGVLDAGDPSRPGIVHRLDKLTSGVMVVAKNNWSHRALSQQFKSRAVRKEYLALVYGKPTPSEATIDLPIGRDFRDRKKISARARRKRTAITHYRVEKTLGPFSLLRVRIETGRTHQIRVHLASRGHPVVGDTLYGGHRGRGLNNIALRALVERLPRFFLHAHRLEFQHPRSGEHLSFTSPLPPELEEILTAGSSPRFTRES